MRGDTRHARERAAAAHRARGVALGSGDDRGSPRLWFSAIKEPYALIVRDAGGLWAIDTDAAAISLDRLCERVPGLDSVLAGL